MPSKKAKEKQQIRQAALDLLHEALTTDDIDISTQLIRKARRHAQKVRMRIPPVIQRRFCKHCYTYLKPGVNCRIRTQPGHVVYTCKTCNKQMRFPLQRRQASQSK